jgi:hypothetical protein
MEEKEVYWIGDPKEFISLLLKTPFGFHLLPGEIGDDCLIPISTNDVFSCVLWPEASQVNAHPIVRFSINRTGIIRRRMPAPLKGWFVVSSKQDLAPPITSNRPVNPK